MTASILVTGNSAAAACNQNGNIVCNGGFEDVTRTPGTDSVVFGSWVGSDPTALRAGTGADGRGTSVEFLFSSTTLSQALTTGIGDLYTVSFQYRSLGGQELTAFFGDARIFSFAGDTAPPTAWSTYSFNVQSFSTLSTLRFVADALGAALNIDGVSVVRCTNCTPNPANNLGAVIDRNRAFYTTTDPAGSGTTLSGIRTLTFDGGTLRPAGAGDLGRAGQPVTLALNVSTTGGIIDNNGQDIALAGSIINTAAAATPFTVTGTGRGTIASTITNQGTLVIAGSGRNTLSGAVANGGGVVAVRNGGQLTITGDVTGGSVAVESGLLSVNGTVTGALTVGTQGTLRGTGRIGGGSTIAGTLRPGNSPGTLTFTAPVIQATGSNLAIEIDGTGTGNGAGNHSRVILTGAGSSYTIASGATLTPILRGITYAPGETAGTNSFTPALGQRLAGVVQAQGGVTGTFASITQPTAGLTAGTRIVALYNPTSIDLVVTAASYGGLAGLTPNHAAAGAAVDALEAARAPGVQPVLNSLAPLGLAGLSTAVAGISGEMNANLPLAAIDVSRAFGRIVEGRRTQPQEAAQTWSVWGRAFGGRARTGEDGNNPGYRDRLAGAMVGFDYGLSAEVRLGLAVGYADSKLTGRQDSGTATIDSYTVGSYLQWTRDALFVDAQLGLTVNRYDTDRDLIIGSQTLRATGDTDGQVLGGGIHVGYRFGTGRLSVEPGAFLRYDGNTSDAFTETGAGSFNLAVAEDRHSELRAGLGARISHTVRLADGGAVVTDLSARYDHKILNPGYSVDQSLLGQAFTVAAADPGRDTVGLGGGATLVMGNGVRLTARYEAEVSGERTGHAFTGQVRFQW
jgi:outer membrane autotransporter protein